MKPSLVIIGLGNPGKNYEKTRHNAGFQAIDRLSKEWAEGEWTEKQKFNSLTQDARIVTFPVLLVKPHTYMNRSGEAVKKIVDFYKLDHSQQILILTDDIDLPLGTLRLRKKGGPGTHNGLRSIVTIFGEDFPRLRIGLGEGPKGEDLATWVLNVPPPEEQAVLGKSYDEIPEMVKNFVMEAPAN
jgi:PTH1 family peptidyl-tRNA hydrolase